MLFYEINGPPLRVQNGAKINENLKYIFGYFD
jgi:hypothetical protein